MNAEERWARVEPGIVLDELNAQLAPLRLRFAPDISTASRATIGGMMANNSAGARSVIYGKTIDHVLEQTVVLSDGSVAEFREIPRAAVPTGRLAWRPLYSTVLRLASEHAAEIDRRYPKVLRRVGGYNLDEFTDPAKPVNLIQDHGGLRRNAGRGPGSQAEIGSPAQGQSRDGDLIRRSAGIARSRAGHLEAQPVGDRGDGQVDPRSHPPK